MTDSTQEGVSPALQRVEPAGAAPRRILLGLLAVLVFAAATRVTYMLSKSLVLDEFHSYFHATAQGWEGLMAGLLRDNHPPLTFLVIGAAGAALGTAEWALRSPAFLMGLVEIALVASIAGGLNRRLGSRAGSAAPVWAAAILSASSLHFDYGTQVRMYAFLALFVTISTYALLILLERDDRPETSMKGPATAFALAATAAFHSHYFAVQYIGTLSAAFLLLALLTGRRRALRAFAASAGAAVLLSGPWALTGFRHQLTHALPPGGDDVSIKALAEGFVQLFFHNVRFGGPLRLAFIAGAGLVLWIALRGVYLGVRERQVRTPILLLAASAFAVPVLSWALAALQPRAGFTWHYVLPSAAPAAILFALGARGRLASAVAGIALLLAATLTCMHLARPATEDFRGAVEFALKTHGHTPSEEVSRIVSVEWQPALFPQGQPYDYYAPRLATGPAPEREPMLVGEFTVAKMDRLTSADRVIVVRRSLPDDQHLLRHLTQAFPQRSITAFGFGVDVHVFTR